MKIVNIKPDYSPVHSPTQYKQETLKNVLLLMQLIPFVEAGIVNLIPDPCTFNHSLRKQIWDMAQSRLKLWKPDPEHTKPMEELCKDDFMRSMFGLPDEILKQKIKTASPNSSDEQVEGALDYIKRERLEDPLALLQPIAPGEKGGQFLMSHLAPNFELGFFLAQITGSIMYTDNQHRWEEITGAVNCIGESQESLWEPLAKHMGELDFIFEINPDVNLQIRQKGKLGLIRNVLREIVLNIQRENDPERIKIVTKDL